MEWPSSWAATEQILGKMARHYVDACKKGFRHYKELYSLLCTAELNSLDVEGKE